MRRHLFQALSACLFSCLAITFHAHSQPFTSSDTTRVSIGTYTGASQITAAAQNPRMSRNGRFIVFESTSTTLVNTSSGIYSGFSNINGTNRQIYMVDRQAGTLELISINAAATNAAPMDCNSPVVSADGRYVAYIATTTGAQAQQMNTRIDGDLTDGNSCLRDTACHVNRWQNGTHVWIRDRLANENFLATQVTIPVKMQVVENGALKTTTAKRCATTGGSCASTACDAASQVDTTIPVIETRNIRIAQGILSTGSNHNPTFSNATAANPGLSGDGKFIVYDSDSDILAGVTDAVIDDPTCGTDYNVSQNNGNLGLNFFILPDSTYLDGNGSVRDVFVRDGSELTNKIASYSCKYHSPEGCHGQGAQDAINGSISDDGTKVAWESSSFDLLSLDTNSTTDVFLSLRSSLNGEVQELQRISNKVNRIVSSNGTSSNASISADGRFVAFQSTGSDIVTSDSNSASDVFIYDTKFFTTVRCLNSSGVEGNGGSVLPRITGNGESVGFYSGATNFGATSGVTNAFVGYLTKNTVGRLVSCDAALASPGTSGTGANANVVNVGVGTVPRSSDSESGIRSRVTTVVYQSAASNLSSSSDTNSVADVYQAPTCSSEDLSTDTDGDGTVDCFDQCLEDVTKVEDVDTDTDGIPDCEDGCPSDSQKISVGICGCGIVDTDTDADGTPDCTDTCPNDPDKTAPGVCGCGQPDEDLDQNGVKDCKEGDNPTPTPGGPTATPAPGASPTPTATPIFTEIKPLAPEVERAGNQRLSIRLLTDKIPLSGLLRYEVQVVGTTGGVRRVKTYRVSPTASNTLLLTRLRAGSYRARIRGVSSLGEATLWGTYSKAVIVR